MTASGAVTRQQIAQRLSSLVLKRLVERDEPARPVDAEVAEIVELAQVAGTGF